MSGPNMSMTLNETNDLPLPSLQALIDRHGAVTIGLAFLRAAFARNTHPPDALILSDHLRRDIGLERRDARRGWDF